MAVGKQKKQGKGGRKGGKKKAVDPFSKKEWYNVKVPAYFAVRNIGKTLVTKTVGTKIASEALKGRVFEVSLADLQNDEVAYRKMKMVVEEVRGRDCLTNFHGMSLTRDKLCSIVKKWQTLIEAHVDAKTTDGYSLRVFALAFTKRHPLQQRKTSYCQSTQVRKLRKKMVKVIQDEITQSDLKDVVNKLIPDSIAKDIEKACSPIFPVQDVFIRKVKILKKPKVDVGKLMELHGEGAAASAAPVPAAEDTGEAIVRGDRFEPPVQAAV